MTVLQAGGVPGIIIEQGGNMVPLHEPDLSLCQAQVLLVAQFIDKLLTNTAYLQEMLFLLPEYSFHTTTMGYQLLSFDIAYSRHQCQGYLVY